MNHLARKTRSALIWSTGGTLLSNFVQVGVVAILARLLSPADFGVYAAALVFISFLQIIAEAGVGPALIQRKDLTPLHIQSASVLSLLLFCGIGLALALFAPLCGRMFAMPELPGSIRLLSLWLPMRGLSIVPESLLLRNLRFDIYAKVQLASYVTGFGLVSIVLALSGAGYWSLMIGNFSQMALYAVMVTWICRRDLKLGFARKEAGDLLHYGIGNSIATLAAFFADQGSHIVTAKFLGPVQLGLFSRAYQLLVAPAKLIGNTVSKAIFPALAKIQDQSEKMTSIIRGGLSMTGLFSIPMTVVAILFAEDIVHVLLGPAWGGVVPSFQILVVSLAFRSGYRLFDTAAKAVGAVYERAWRNAIYAVAVVLFALWGCRHGMNRVAWGNTAAISLNFLLMMQLCCDRLGSSNWRMLRALQGGCAAGLFVGVCELPVYWFVKRPGIPAWAVLGVALLVALLAFILLWRITARRLLGEDGVMVVIRMVPGRMLDRLHLTPPPATVSTQSMKP